MKSIGKTLDYKNKIVEVYECEFCKERSIEDNFEHDCKRKWDI